VSLELGEEEMKRRVLTRGEQGSGRADDNAEALVNRFRDFRAASMPVIELLEGKGMLSRLSSEAAPDEVYRELTALFREAGLAQSKSTSTAASTVRA
jgi:adenylate kinase